MIRLGLIGYPLSHSLSPVIHGAAFHSSGLQGSYDLIPVAPEDRQGLQAALARIRSGELTGLNVTIPHKRTVIDLLDELTPAAQTMGAVNTIYSRYDRLVGENTDAPGFLIDLKRFLEAESPGQGALQTLVLGAGGSARAVVYALHSAGWQIAIAARRREQAQQLIGSLAVKEFQAVDLATLDIDLSAISLIVNTTPLGMSPDVEASPWPEHLPFPPRAAIYDLVYNPAETRLVREARRQGRPATTGLGMLIEQAALAFEIWTGHRPARDALFSGATRALVLQP